MEQHESKVAQVEKAQTTTTPKWLSWTGKASMQTVPVMTSGKTAIIVTGDANRNKVLTVPGGGMTTVKIELPINWDSLMKDLGYKPLNNYYVKIPAVNISQIQPTSQQKSLAQQRTYTNSNSKINGQKRPTAEQYRKIREERRQSSNNLYRNSNTNTQRRPTAEQYRKIRQQLGQPVRNNSN